MSMQVMKYEKFEFTKNVTEEERKIYMSAWDEVPAKYQKGITRITVDAFNVVNFTSGTILSENYYEDKVINLKSSHGIDSLRNAQNLWHEIHHHLWRTVLFGNPEYLKYKLGVFEILLDVGKSPSTYSDEFIITDASKVKTSDCNSCTTESTTFVPLLTLIKKWKKLSKDYCKTATIFDCYEDGNKYHMDYLKKHNLDYKSLFKNEYINYYMKQHIKDMYGKTAIVQSIYDEQNSYDILNDDEKCEIMKGNFLLKNYKKILRL